MYDTEKDYRNSGNHYQYADAIIIMARERWANDSARVLHNRLHVSKESAYKYSFDWIISNDYKQVRDIYSRAY